VVVVSRRLARGSELLNPGQPAPDISLDSTHGKNVKLSLITPLWPVLVIFFRTRCDACRVLMPELKNFQKQYGDADIEILAVSQDGRVWTSDFVNEIGWEGRVLIDHPELAASKDYGVEVLPAAVLVGTDMVVRATADASDLAGFERLARAVAAEVGWPYKPLLRPGIALDEPCLSKAFQATS
jgi:peroxiredoxin